MRSGSGTCCSCYRSCPSHSLLIPSDHRRCLSVRVHQKHLVGCSSDCNAHFLEGLKGSSGWVLDESLHASSCVLLPPPPKGLTIWFHHSFFQEDPALHWSIQARDWRLRWSQWSREQCWLCVTLTGTCVLVAKCVGFIPTPPTVLFTSEPCACNTVNDCSCTVYSEVLCAAHTCTA